MLVDLLRVAALLHQPSVTQAQYDADRKKCCSSKAIAKKFKDHGGWNGALIKAGLAENRTPMNVPNEDLFNNLEEVWAKLGRQPHNREMDSPLSKYSRTTYENRFHGWENALQAFIAYINNEQTPQSEEAIRDKKVEPTTKHKTSRDINLRLRFKVLMRDNFKCKIDGRSPATDPTIILHVDHIKAWANGGETVLENLQTLCSKCNYGKSDLELINWAATEVQNV